MWFLSKNLHFLETKYSKFMAFLNTNQNAEPLKFFCLLKKNISLLQGDHKNILSQMLWNNNSWKYRKTKQVILFKEIECEMYYSIFSRKLYKICDILMQQNIKYLFYCSFFHLDQSLQCSFACYGLYFQL